MTMLAGHVGILARECGKHGFSLPKYFSSLKEKWLSQVHSSDSFILIDMHRLAGRGTEGKCEHANFNKMDYQRLL